MNEKKWRILETAIHLFATRGFHQTSIQQIADGSDVSKGTIYLYFTSKNDLIASIFKYLHTQIEEELSEIEEGPGAPKEKFHNKILTHLNEMKKHREFIMLQLRESSLTLDESLLGVLKKLHTSIFHSDQLMLLNVYGEEFRPHAADGALVLDALRSSVTHLLLTEEGPAPLDKLAAFIVHRMDEMAAGMCEKSLAPILNKSGMSDGKNRILAVTEEMKDTLGSLSLPPERKEDVLHTIEYIQEELKKPDPKPFIIRGMLINFSGLPHLESLGRKLVENLTFTSGD
ncbi:TetR/AcrR family transcriptional regulator [Salimicrobium flavidum]|uniref:Transcriptional regulator, TetR family n=1 Tax=Salimicrobium flavidum TaxID=570947 RepID=A0A1N7J9B9_9BACI|nr:TetR/AcrR family transcriptional regulator [Salimicrobium flavidum]SIS45953.1 transcriptional regulator, TetR family [Salimicrobium flavidum]